MGPGDPTTPPSRWTLVALGLSLAIIAGSAVWIHRQFWGIDLNGQDIYYTWLDGHRIATGENPYSRIVSGNMLQNDKYPTYFPAIYLAAAGAHWLGVTSFSTWVPIWRAVVFVAQLAVGAVIFVAIRRRRLLALAVLGAAFWTLNRWTVVVADIAQIDFIPILLLVGSLVLFERGRRTKALLAYSLSLAFKQIGIFLLPLYVIWSWKSESRHSTWKTTALALSIPLLPPVPFLLWDAEGFVRSIAFSMTREPDSHMGANSMDAVVGLSGVVARAPMLALMGLVYLAVSERNYGVYAPPLLILAIFTSFNPVLFVQYMCWMIPLLPLAVASLAVPKPSLSV